MIETYHGHVDVASVQLEVDLLVNSGLALLMVVLTAHRSHLGFGVKRRKREKLKTRNNRSDFVSFYHCRSRNKILQNGGARGNLSQFLTWEEGF